MMKYASALFAAAIGLCLSYRRVTVLMVTWVKRELMFSLNQNRFEKKLSPFCTNPVTTNDFLGRCIPFR